MLEAGRVTRIVLLGCLTGAVALGGLALLLHQGNHRLSGSRTENHETHAPRPASAGPGEADTTRPEKESRTAEAEKGKAPEPSATSAMNATPGSERSSNERSGRGGEPSEADKAEIDRIMKLLETAEDRELISAFIALMSFDGKEIIPEAQFRNGEALVRNRLKKEGKSILFIMEFLMMHYIQTGNMEGAVACLQEAIGDVEANSLSLWMYDGAKLTTPELRAAAVADMRRRVSQFRGEHVPSNMPRERRATSTGEVIRREYTSKPQREANELALKSYDEHDYRKAEALFASINDFENAAACFEEVLLQTSTPINHKQLDEIIAKYPKTEQAALALTLEAELYDRAKDYDKALTTREDVLKRYPEGPTAAEVNYRVAEHYYGKHDDDKAIYYFKEAYRVSIEGRCVPERLVYYLLMLYAKRGDDKAFRELLKDAAVKAVRPDFTVQGFGERTSPMAGASFAEQLKALLDEGGFGRFAPGWQP